MSLTPKILLVEDDHIVAEALAQALQKFYDLDIAGSGKLALYKADRDTFDLIILDLNLPDIHGLNVCQQLRERGCRAPVLVLTGDHKVMTKIDLLDNGANDFLTKPFSLGELKARLRVLLRTRINTNYREKLAVDDLTLNRNTFSVSRGDTQIALRPKEFLLLECLMDNAGSVVSRNTLNHHVWQTNTEPWTNTVEVHVKNLRDKIDRPFLRPLIKTVHGHGYKIDSTNVMVIGSK